MTRRELKQSLPTCPRCGSPVIVFERYVACERFGCGGMIGMPLSTIRDLRRLYPERCSESAADAAVK